MSFDLSDHLASMTRRVENGERDGEATIIVHASRVFPVSPTGLWDALSRPERLSRWFLPVSGNLEPGGKYQFQGNAGGTIQTCEPPRTIGVTWEYGGGSSWLTLRLSPEDGGTRLELIHEAHPMPEFSDVYGPGAVGVGWDLGFMGLARHLVDPDAYPNPPEQDEWATSAEALDLYRTLSAAWGRAAEANGTPAELAEAAAERTRAFYSGESTPGG
jgi:uncharacterized protein YndB with AHSA1/START domain